jgi:hypothetical protein
MNKVLGEKKYLTFKIIFLSIKYYNIFSIFNFTLSKQNKYYIKERNS